MEAFMAIDQPIVSPNLTSPSFQALQQKLLAASSARTKAEASGDSLDVNPAAAFSMNRLVGPADTSNPEFVAKEFESVFASILLKQMRATLEPGTMFGDDHNDIYGGLFDLHMGQVLAGEGGLGLAATLKPYLEES